MNKDAFNISSKGIIAAIMRNRITVLDNGWFIIRFSINCPVVASVYSTVQTCRQSPVLC